MKNKEIDLYFEDIMTVHKVRSAIYKSMIESDSFLNVV